MSANGPSPLLFVIGMHRSGTSALTRVLSLSGASLPDEVGEPGFDNPTGHWEPPLAKELNDHFLIARGSSWDDTGLGYRRSPNERAGFGRYASLTMHFGTAIDGFLARQRRSGAPLVIKEPRITALLPYWLAAAARTGFSAKVLHVFRNPADVAASLAVRNGTAFDHAALLWRKYTLLGERDSRGIPRTFVSYESLMLDWRAQLARCCREIGVDPAAEPHVIAAVDAFLSPQLHHHRDEPVGAAAAAAEGWHETLRAHGELRRAAAGAPDLAAFDRLFDTYAGEVDRRLERHSRTG